MAVYIPFEAKLFSVSLIQLKSQIFKLPYFVLF